jgi:hypothetical protein
MTAPASVTVSESPHLGFVDRVAAWLSCGLSIWVFLALGWSFLRPADPLGPVTIWTSRSAVLMLVGSAALACGLAMIGAVLAGRRLPDIGLLAAALGLGIASLRGDTAEFFVLEGTELYGNAGRSLSLRFAVESLGWAIVVGLAALASAAVASRIFRPSSERGSAAPIPAGADAALLAARGSAAASGSVPTQLALGLQHSAVVAAVGFFAFMLFSVGSGIRAIQHGQVMFTVAAAIAVGVYAGHHVAPVRSALWAIIGVVALALAGYLWAAFWGDPDGRPPTVPFSPFMRVLPLQFITAGTCSAIIMFWYMYHPARGSDPSHRHSEPRP